MTPPMTINLNPDSLDEALYVASCMAGNWPNNRADIWGTVDRNRHEHYNIQPIHVRPIERDDSAPWHIDYAVIRGEAK